MGDRLRLESVAHAHGSTMVLSGAELVVREGETAIVSGRSGCGKSTLLEVCAGLLKPLAGKVFIDGKDLWTMSRGELVRLRRRIGYVFQTNALISNRTAFENVALPVRRHRELPASQVQFMVSEHMERMGVYELRDKRPEELSLGQARQVAIARALVLDPDLLFLDEPDSGLDPVTAHAVVRLIKNARRRQNITIVMVSHILHFIRQMQASVWLLEDGVLSPLREGQGASGDTMSSLMSGSQ